MNLYAFSIRLQQHLSGRLSQTTLLRTLALLAVFTLFLPLCVFAQQDVIDISGTWTVRLADGQAI